MPGSPGLIGVPNREVRHDVIKTQPSFARRKSLRVRYLLQSPRELLGTLGLGTAAVAVGGSCRSPPVRGAKLSFGKNVRYSTAEPANSYEDITTYNNFYEFGTVEGRPGGECGIAQDLSPGASPSAGKRP